MALVDNTEPLRLADGRLVYPGGKIVDPSAAPNLIEVPTNREAQKLVVATRRKLADMPEVPRTMNAISVILSYSLFGLDDTEIALATGMSEKQIGQIKMNDAYTSMHQTVVDGILNSESNDVRTIFSQHSRSAANVIVDGLHNGSRGDRMLAAKDLLDRAGHRPADIVEHRHRMDGGLTIEIVRKDQNNQPPVIEMELPDGC